MKRLERCSAAQMWGCSELKEETGLWSSPSDTSSSDSGENKALSFHWLAKEEVHLAPVWSAVSLFKMSVSRSLQSKQQPDVLSTKSSVVQNSFYFRCPVHQPLVMSRQSLLSSLSFALAGCKKMLFLFYSNLAPTHLTVIRRNSWWIMSTRGQSYLDQRNGRVVFKQRTGTLSILVGLRFIQKLLQASVPGSDTDTVERFIFLHLSNLFSYFVLPMLELWRDLECSYSALEFSSMCLISCVGCLKMPFCRCTWWPAHLQCSCVLCVAQLLLQRTCSAVFKGI